LTLNILYEDDHLVVLNKSAGIHSCANSKSDNHRSIAALLIKQSPQCSACSDKPEDGGLAHRLDFQTSGVLVAGKTREAWLRLREALSGKACTKRYLALLEGEVAADIKVEAYIGTPYRRARKVRAYASKPADRERALAATTEFHPQGFNSEVNVSLTEALIKSGRRHQIRTHAAHMGHPLLGDDLYGSCRKLTEALEVEASIQLPLFFLHAYAIDFEHPLTGQRVHVEAPLPPYCRSKLFGEEFRRRCNLQDIVD